VTSSRPPPSLHAHAEHSHVGTREAGRSHERDHRHRRGDSVP
jgi:hypothetical protein